MSQTLIERMGAWFKRGRTGEGDLPLMRDISGSPEGSDNSVIRATPARKPKVEDTLANLSTGFQTLTDLMSSVRDNLERQSARQEQLIDHLSHLPQALQSTADSNRMQSDTLKAIHIQMANQGEQTKQLTSILDKLHDSGGNQQEILDSLRERVENLHQQDKYVSDTLHGVGNALQAVSQSGQNSTELLRQMREDTGVRNDKLEIILRKQSARFTTMLSIALFLSIGALIAVVAVGYLVLTKAR